MLEFVLSQSLGAAVLAGLVWLTVRWFRPRPAVAHLLWLVVLAKLVTPPLVRWHAPILPTADVAAPAVEPRARPAERTIHLDLRSRPGDPSRAALVPTAPPAAPAEARARTNASSPPPSTRGWPEPLTWLFAAWLAGALWTGARLWRTGAALRAQIRSATLAPARLEAQLRDLAAQLGVRPPRLRVVHGISGPFLCGLRRPVLCWPERWEAGDASATVLAHELAHLLRRDHWVARLEVALALLHWWNPLFWWARAQMREHAERACDAWAVWATPRRRHAYATALVDALEQHIHPSAMVALGALPSSRRAFEERLRMILQPNATKNRLTFWSALPVGVTALALLAGPAFSQDARNEQRQTRVLRLRDQQDPEQNRQQKPTPTKAVIKITVNGVDIEDLPAEQRAAILGELRLPPTEGHAHGQAEAHGHGQPSDHRVNLRERRAAAEAEQHHVHQNPLLAKILGEVHRELRDDEDIVRLGIGDEIEGLVRVLVEGDGNHEQAITGLVEGLIDGIADEIDVEIADDEDLRKLGLATPLRGTLGRLIRDPSLQQGIRSLVAEVTGEIQDGLGDLDVEVLGDLDIDLELDDLAEVLDLGEHQLHISGIAKILGDLDGDSDGQGVARIVIGDDAHKDIVQDVERVIGRVHSGQGPGTEKEVIILRGDQPQGRESAPEPTPAHEDLEAALEAARRELEAARRQLEALERQLRRDRRDR